MPFRTTNKLPDPTVRVFFSGQLILQPLSGDRCKVLVNRTAPGHHLSIEVRKKQAGRPDDILMRHFGPLPPVRLEGAALKPIFGMLIEVNRPAGAEKGVNAFFSDPAGEDGSLEHAFDLAKHHPGLVVSEDEPGAHPAILLDDGTLHTAARTSADLDVTLTKTGGPAQPLNPVASLIGANINLPTEEEGVSVRLRLEGVVKSLTLKRQTDGSTYEIFISNDPLFAELPPEVTHEELNDYYRTLPQVDSSQRFKLEFKLKPDRGSTRTPCTSVLNNI